MESYYAFLSQFTKGTTPNRKNLERHYSPKFIDEAINSGYIIEIGKDDIGYAVYTITEKGIDKRDN